MQARVCTSRSCRCCGASETPAVTRGSHFDNEAIEGLGPFNGDRDDGPDEFGDEFCDECDDDA